MIQKYKELPNVGYVVENGKLKHFVPVDNSGERVGMETFKSAALAKAFYESEKCPKLVR